MTPLDPSHKIRIEIPHKTTCLPAPPLFSDLQWWLERSEQRATEDMTSVGTEDMSSVAEVRVMLGGQITSQEPKNHAEEIQPCVWIFLSGLPGLGVSNRAGFFLRNSGLALCSGQMLV